jgi:lactaldehyde reductase
MDALTHAIEGYITKAAWEMTDMFHLEAIRLISKYLRSAVKNEKEGREGMALGQYIAGMGFSNVGLGIVHSMAHGLSAHCTTRRTASPAPSSCRPCWTTTPTYTGEKYLAPWPKPWASEGADKMNADEFRKAAVDAVRTARRRTSESPQNLKGIREGRGRAVPFRKSAFADACRPGNPRDTSVEEIAAFYRSLM